jgi:hypothetical protein
MVDVVDPGYGAYLKAPARYINAAVGTAAATWGDKAITSTIVSPISLAADAQTEATRQAQFLAGPIARDSHLVKGLRRDLIGKLITLQGDRLGYDGAGALAFVIGAAESSDVRTTTLTVLKRL